MNSNINLTSLIFDLTYLFKFVLLEFLHQATLLENVLRARVVRENFSGMLELDFSFFWFH